MNEASRRALLGSAALLATGLVSPARAQGFPSRAIQLVVPYPPGGAADALTRPLALRLKDLLGQAVVIENKSGANGILGMQAVAGAQPDGHTLVLGAIGPLSVSPALQKMPFDPQRDFAPVAFLAAVPNVLVVNASTPLKSVQELVALAKQKPGELNYGSAGAASSNQLAAELFNQAARVKIAHIPYKGGAPAQADLLAGHLTVIFDNLPPSLPHIRSGAFRPLAVTSLRRQPSLPDVPTMAELGYPNFEAGSWFGLLAPAATPRPVIERLNRAVVDVLRDPAMRETYAKQGFDLNPGTPEQFAEFIRSEATKWQAVVKSAGIVNP
ncbi:MULTISPECIES: Bug family tripartite tricarboxylate transporter substrate binding protein [Ramlibacter]|uniref:Tripartite tricarboxylate transporter substrate binding protein n=1 Tax=Ramlibacter pinisoli TaxID=2682844 RepID=A0A6N8IT27_9BURK|nr:MULTISPECIES: tripartite tricarboxylate transporter substrate binding protein [Ramlibacter]MBA2965022.1 tripartite tricarboxylate transporter substrate binding protein [Ramlibacter sp. CGMCC 1.13660]MVQ29987.1 tripartite tricarboxylate transporter substrate binding protein [Ramlibacter pinisoli]